MVGAGLSVKEIEKLVSFFFFLIIPFLFLFFGGWKNGSVVKGTCCSGRGSRFSFQPAPTWSIIPITTYNSSSRGNNASLTSVGSCTHMMQKDTQAYTQHTK